MHAHCTDTADCTVHSARTHIHCSLRTNMMRSAVPVSFLRSSSIFFDTIATNDRTSNKDLHAPFSLRWHEFALYCCFLLILFLSLLRTHILRLLYTVELWLLDRKISANFFFRIFRSLCCFYSQILLSECRLIVSRMCVCLLNVVRKMSHRPQPSHLHSMFFYYSISPPFSMMKCNLSSQ